MSSRQDTWATSTGGAGLVCKTWPGFGLQSRGGTCSSSKVGCVQKPCASSCKTRMRSRMLNCGRWAASGVPSAKPSCSQACL